MRDNEMHFAVMKCTVCEINFSFSFDSLMNCNSQTISSLPVGPRYCCLNYKNAKITNTWLVNTVINYIEIVKKTYHKKKIEGNENILDAQHAGRLMFKQHCAATVDW